ncbi:MAG: aldehyde dehydrogenase family protein [Pseudomonadota bacterium]
MINEIPRPEFTEMLIGGQWLGALGGQTFTVNNPARGQDICEVPRAGAADVDRAVIAAAQAFETWKKLAPRERGKLLLAIGNEIDAQNESLARLLALETGNALRTQARPELKTAAEVFRYFGGVAGELKGETIPIDERMLNFTVRSPIGVVGAIIPWNAPAILASVKIAPALCAGNTMVLKTAEDAPLTVLAIAAICAKHLPPGVLNVLTGFGADCGAALTTHPGISKLSFTGSTAVGRSVMRAASERIVPVSLELGGKSPSIIFPDADQDWVADGVIAAARISRQSQSCTAGTRLFVHDKVFDSFVERVAGKLKAIRMGDPLDEQTDMGSLINSKQYERVCSFIQEGLDNPAIKLAAGGLPAAGGAGFFTPPTLFTGVDNGWRLAQEEIFGPVLCAIRWSDPDEMLRQANATHYGLAAYVWTHDIGAALRTVDAIDAGFVQVNQGFGQFPGQAYGGMKQSGIGREYSLEGMLESFTARKNVCLNVRTPSAAA